MNKNKRDIFIDIENINNSLDITNNNLDITNNDQITIPRHDTQLDIEHTCVNNNKQKKNNKSNPIEHIEQNQQNQQNEQTEYQKKTTEVLNNKSGIPNFMFINYKSGVGFKRSLLNMKGNFLIFTNKKEINVNWETEGKAINKIIQKYKKYENVKINDINNINKNIHGIIICVNTIDDKSKSYLKNNINYIDNIIIDNSITNKNKNKLNQIITIQLRQESINTNI